MMLAAAAPASAVDPRSARPSAPGSPSLVTSSAVRPLLAPVVAPTPTPAGLLGNGQPLRWVYMVGSTIPASLRDHADQIDVLSPAWFHADANGMLYGNDSPAVTAFAKAHGIKVVPIVANGEFQQSVSHALVSDGNRQTNLMDSLQWLVNTFGYEGVNIDFENIAPADRDLFSGMMSNVYARLHPLNKLVTAALPSKTAETYGGFSGPFDYAALAPNLDLALIMAYDQHYAGGPAGPIADVAWVNDVLNYATTQIPAKKVLLGLPFYGYNWIIGRNGARSMSYGDIENTVLGTGAQIQMDAASQSPFFTYSGHLVWFENSASLKAKTDLVGVHGLAGWGGWRLGQEDPNFWSLTVGRGGAKPIGI
jgi:spore germination protein